MALQVVWAECSVTHPDTQEDTILRKFDLVPDWVDDFTKFVLTSTGAARFVDDSAPEPAPPAEPVRLQEHPPLESQFAQAERGTAAGEAAARLAAERGTATGQQVGDGGPKRPAQADPKAAWVDYAVASGADRGRAEEATKDELMSTKPDRLAERFAAK
jgi:hypothetical protein